MFEFNHKKAVQALNIMAIKEGGTINKMKALKLIWLADRLHIRLYGRPVTMDIYYAMPYGPVPSNTKDMAEESDFLSEEEREYRNSFLNIIDQYNYSSAAEPDFKPFSKTDLEAINKVYDEFGDLDQFKLADLSHLYPEWKKYQNAIEQKQGTRFQMKYEDFFADPDEKNTNVFDQTDELREITKEMYIQNAQELCF
ncbi:Panacea domain-containing protein [Anaerophaga thermohalophila]|uniref:Panacea domain-containing protein n=1 Tax=Anaerophaga thermohalophila TaxID=177400 RepID=UPI000237CDF8|nr:Panacea domain-containing protein [Anaerophaga thermohalophila]